jgi:tetratricopeptide (TPR) repeat protein
MVKGNIKAAILDYDKAIEIDGQFAEAYANRGLALLMQGKRSEADRDFEQSLRLEPALKPTLDVRINKVKREIAAR